MPESGLWQSTRKLMFCNYSYVLVMYLEIIQNTVITNSGTFYRYTVAAQQLHIYAIQAHDSAYQKSVRRIASHTSIIANCFTHELQCIYTAVLHGVDHNAQNPYSDMYGQLCLFDQNKITCNLFYNCIGLNTDEATAIQLNASIIVSHHLTEKVIRFIRGLKIPYRMRSSFTTSR